MISAPPIVIDVDRLSDRIWVEVETEDESRRGHARVIDLVLAATNWPIMPGDYIEEGGDGRLWWYPLGEGRSAALEGIAPVEVMRFGGRAGADD